MSRFRRQLKAAQDELDLLDRAVILTFDYSMWGEQNLQGIWPEDHALRTPATMEQMIYLCEDRLESAIQREADRSVELFSSMLDGLRRIRDDIPGPGEL